MPKFLNHLNLNGNQLKNAKLEITDSPTQAKGIIHYHDSTNSVRVYTGSNNSDFFTLGDNDVATASSAGTVELFSDTVQSIAANTVTATTGRTYGIQFNSNGQMVVNVPWSDTNTNTNQLTTFNIGVDTNSTNTVIAHNETLTFTGGTGISTETTADGTVTFTNTAPAGSSHLNSNTTASDVGLGNVENKSAATIIGEITGSDIPNNAADTTGNAATATKLAASVNIAGVAFDGSTSITLNNNNITNGAGYITSSANISGTAAGLSSTLAIGSGGTGQTTAAAAANALLNTSQGGALTIGATGDVITIGGDLVVTGTQTTTLSNTVKTGDNFIELATNNSANSTDFGWYGKFVDSGTKYAGMNFDASATKFKLGFGDDVPGTTIDWDTAGHLEVGALTNAGNFIMDGVTITGINDGSEFDNDNSHLMTSAAIKAKIDDNDNGFLTAHPNITAASSSTNTGRTYIQSLGVDGNGHVTSISTAEETVTDTQRSAGTGMSLSTNTLNVNVDGTNSEAPQTSTTTSGRTYKVQVDGSDNLVVNVPWSDTNTNTQLAIANTTEAVAGSNDTKAMTAAKVADRSVTCTIDVSDSTFQSNLFAEITHDLGTADIIVQLYDVNTEETVVADVFRTDKAGSASTSKIKVVFSAAPAAANDIRVLITSLKGAQTGTVAYS